MPAHVRYGPVSVLEARRVVEAAHHVQCDAEKAQDDEGDVEKDVVVEEEDAGAMQEPGATGGIPLVQRRDDGAGRLEADGSAAEAGGEDEGAQDGGEVVGD